MTVDECLTDSTLRELLQDESAAASDVLDHLSQCACCQQSLEHLATASVISTDRLRSLPPAAEIESAKRVIRDRDLNSTRPTHETHRGLDDWPAILDPALDSDCLGTLGPFQIQKVLGQGGMGIVLQGHDPQLQRQVAIKIPLLDLAQSPRFRQQFLREARAAAALSHENVVSIFQVDEHRDHPYLVMELIRGGTLADRLSELQVIPEPELIALASGLAKGLAAAHQAGLIHGDLKPSNILWKEADNVYKISDFGLASFREEQRQGIVAGTPAYMSPEQANGERLDPRTDLYSLGLILRDCATGQVPAAASFGPMNPTDLARSHLPAVREDVPGLSRPMAKIIDALLNPDAEQRPTSAAQLADDLARLPQAARRPMPFALAGGAFALILAAAFVTGEALDWIDFVDGVGGNRKENPAPLFQVAGSDLGGNHLADVIRRAPDGARIEILQIGPHAIDPIVISGKRMTLSGRSGTRPILIPKQIAGDHPTPLISSDSDLTLRSLEIRYQVDPPQERDDWWERTAILVRGAKLQLDSCRLQVGRSNVAIAVYEGQMECRGCELVGGQGVGVVWRPHEGCQLQVSDSLLATRAGMIIDSDSILPSNESTHCVLERNTFRSERCLQLATEFSKPLSQTGTLRVNADRNLFAAPHIVSLPIRSRSLSQDLSALQKNRLLYRRLRWSGLKNVYQNKTSFASFQLGTRRLSPLWDEPLPVDDWQMMWDFAEAESAEAKLEFVGDNQSNDADDHRLTDVQITDGSLPEWITANIADEKTKRNATPPAQ